MKKSVLFIGIITSVIIALLGYMKTHKMNLNDIGLATLSLAKGIKGEHVDLSAIQSSHTPLITHQIWHELLQKYVSKHGQVNYKGLIKEKKQLQKYLNLLRHHVPGKNWSTPEQIAYWINAYNAFTVQLILNHYPLRSIKDIADGMPMINSPWDIKFFKIGHTDFDLNTIEHQILRKKFQEPRIHFAINCASVSCPKLRNEAYVADQLEKQLEQQARDFINDTQKNKITVYETKLSAIFNWFQSDFIQKTDLLTYLKKYNPNLNPRNKIEYLDYNWSLNE